MDEQKIIGREDELSLLQEIIDSRQPEFLAVYGRRRVGKTFLISEFFKTKGLYFELTGIKDATKAVQLKNFSTEYGDRFRCGQRGPVPKDWIEAFTDLRHQLEASSFERIILFFDELPWLASPRAGFLEALDHLWNRHLSRDPRVILIVCGSAASWMIKKVIGNRGGLYGRLTRQLRLRPFTVHQAEKFLQVKGIDLDRKQMVEIYMALGGIPKYLAEVKRGESSAQAVQRLLFSPTAELAVEFHRLYASLFDDANTHLAVIRELAKHRYGLSKNEILARVDRLSSGGASTDLLNELEQSGFISYMPSFGMKKKEGHYFLIDEYSLFYLTWVEPVLGPGSRPINAQHWMRQYQTPSYRSWSGYAFEAVCMKHVDQIIRALNLSVVATSCVGWRSKAGETEVGAQIDLVIQRADRCINLCEIKFADSVYEVTKSYASELEEKKRVFREQTGTRSTLFTTLITPYGAKRNSHFLTSVESQVTIDDLFTDRR